MGLDSDLSWAHKKGYYHHSNPSTPDYYTFFHKGVLRPARAKAMKVLEGNAEGDKGQSKAILAAGGHYKDYLGKSQYNDNINMASGRAVEYYCDLCLMKDASPNEAYREALNVLTSLQTGSWIDQEKTAAQIEVRQ